LMTPRDRVLALIRGDAIDRIPFAHCERHLPRGDAERIARNKGMALLCNRPCCIERFSSVEMRTRTGRSGRLVRSYHTPKGTLTETLAAGIGYGVACFGRDWMGMVPQTTEYMVKKTQDYEVLKFIVEDLHYEPYYRPIEDQMKRLGSDGIVIAELPYEPMLRLLLEFVGIAGLFRDLTKNRSLVEEVCDILQQKYEEELFPLAAGAPSEVVLYGGNIDGYLVNPPMFERYFLDTYSKCAEILHHKGKMMAVHMDGRLASLSDLIARSSVDIIDGFTPPPMGDLPIDKALNLWPNKTLWVNFPSSVSTAPGASPRAVKQYLARELGLMIPGERVMVVASTENYVPEDSIVAMAELMENVTLPLSTDIVSKLNASCY
jgi:hypothetical protein